MPSVYCSFGLSADSACHMWHTGRITEGLHCTSLVSLDWDSLAATPILPETTASSLPDGTVGVDVLHVTWLIVVTYGGAIRLVDQKDYANIDTLLDAASLSGPWQVWGRVIDGKIGAWEQTTT